MHEASSYYDNVSRCHDFVILPHGLVLRGQTQQQLGIIAQQKLSQAQANPQVLHRLLHLVQQQQQQQLGIITAAPAPHPR